MNAKFISILVILTLIGVLLTASCAPSPESMAAASATVMRAHQVGTEAAVSLNESARGTQTAVAVLASGAQTAQALDFSATRTSGTRVAEQTETIGTRVAKQTETVWESQVGATRTAEPHNAALVATRAQTDQAGMWAGALGLAGLAIVSVMLGLAVVQWAHTRAKLIPRGANGLLPGVLVNNTTLNPGQELGPVTVHAPGRIEQLLWSLYLMRYFVLHGRMPEDLSKQPKITIEKVDGDATADHRLAAHQSAQLPQGVAAMFQPWKRGNAVDRDDRLSLAQRTAGVPLVALPQGQTGMSLVQPRVVSGDTTAIEIARALGHELPIVEFPSITEGESQDLGQAPTQDQRPPRWRPRSGDLGQPELARKKTGDSE